MMHVYCARLTPSRNTALGIGSFCNAAAFFSPKYPVPQRSESKISVTQDTNGKVTNSQLHVDITNES